MRSEIVELLTRLFKPPAAFDVTPAPRPELGHFSTNLPLRLAKISGKAPLEIAEEMTATILREAPAGMFDKVEAVAPGFLNFRLSAGAIRRVLDEIEERGEKFGRNKSAKGKRVLVEYTDPNPFKLFHIGHLMPNLIGEAIARLFEASGAEVVRLNYQGDVGLHVASSVWGMTNLGEAMPKEAASLREKMEFLGRAYAAGSKAYKENDKAKAEIDALNKKIYERSDPEVSALYDLGRKWSLDYFETIYVRLGTKFAHYFFESEVGADGMSVVKAHPEVFKESQGAIIFPGEEHGLHNRVFVSAAGLPTYEAKELGLNKKKFEMYKPDLSLVVTGNEINDYFRVLLKAMELTLPEVAAKTKHIGHGMLRLPTGKMSSRTGDVITAESLIDKVKEAVAEKMKDYPDLSAKEKEDLQEQIALAAIRYSILKQGIGGNIIFDMEKSIAFQGDSGPYLQYTHARLRSILRKAGPAGTPDRERLTEAGELALILKLSDFPSATALASAHLAPNLLALYLFELANAANKFYEENPVLKDEDAARRAARLSLVENAAAVLKRGMDILGIQAPEKI